MEQIKERYHVSRAAVMLCLEEGILTEEAPVEWYREVVRVYREIEPDYRIPVN